MKCENCTHSTICKIKVDKDKLSDLYKGIEINDAFNIEITCKHNEPCRQKQDGITSDSYFGRG